MDKLAKILGLCKCGVYLTVNEHRDVRQSASDRIAEIVEHDIDEVSDADAEEMIRTDTIVELQFYPRTPIGFYRVTKPSLEAALDEALDILKDKDQP